MAHPAEPKGPRSSAGIRCLDIDVTNTEQQNVILRLCKKNKSQYVDVWMHLRQTHPPDATDKLKESIEKDMSTFKESIAAWDLHGIIAVDGSVTDNNPTGRDKVVGFLLYHIHRETKQELRLSFLLVDYFYRKKGHASNMIKACRALHLHTPRHMSNITKACRALRLCTPNNDTKKVCDKVDFIVANVNDTVSELYKKLGFEEDTAGCTKATAEQEDDYKTMVLGRR